MQLTQNVSLNVINDVKFLNYFGQMQWGRKEGVQLVCTTHKSRVEELEHEQGFLTEKELSLCIALTLSDVIRSLSSRNMKIIFFFYLT